MPPGNKPGAAGHFEKNTGRLSCATTNKGIDYRALHKPQKTEESSKMLSPNLTIDQQVTHNLISTGEIKAKQENLDNKEDTYSVDEFNDREILVKDSADVNGETEE